MIALILIAAAWLLFHWFVTTIAPKPIAQSAPPVESIPIPYFDGRLMEIHFDEIKATDQDAKQALALFLSLSPTDRRFAGNYIYENYKMNAMATAEDFIKIDADSPDEIWSFIHPSLIRVSRRKTGSGGVFVSVEMECDWDQKSGLAIVYREGNSLSRVSDQDGFLTFADAHGLPESEDRIA